MIPLRCAGEGTCAAVRQYLDEAGYKEAAILERLRLGAMHEVLSGKRVRDGWRPLDLIGRLANVFLLGHPALRDELAADVPEGPLAAMEETGLLAAHGHKQGAVCAGACLYPVGDIYVASDRLNTPDGSPFQAPDDVVYPAITKNTSAFLRLLPSSPCEEMLELCAGTGVAALTALHAGCCQRAWATDIAERSVRFAEFNGRLNGLSGLEALVSDVYAGVEEQTFDRIVAHPPYVPSRTSKWLYRDAGEAGEEITHKVIAGAPEHLRPGGRLYCLAIGLEMKDEPLEQRLRQWLGAHSGECDVALFELESYNPRDTVSQSVLAGQRSFHDYIYWRDWFEEARVERCFYGMMVVQKHDAPRRSFTIRRDAGPRTTSREIEWLLDWETRCMDPAVVRRLLGRAPVAAEGLRLQVTHEFQEGSLVPSAFQLQTDHPFEMTCGIQPWTAQVIARCDGSSTVQQILDYCRNEELIRGEVEAEDFAILMRMLVSSGFVTFAEPTSPQAAG